jgi:hypothetical protein
VGEIAFADQLNRTSIYCGATMGKGPSNVGTPKILSVSHAATSFVVAPPARHPNTYINPKLPTVLWWPNPRHSQTPILSNHCQLFYRDKRRKHPNVNIILQLPINLLCPTHCHLILSYPQGLMPTFTPCRTSLTPSSELIITNTPINSPTC